MKTFNRLVIGFAIFVAFGVADELTSSAEDEREIEKEVLEQCRELFNGTEDDVNLLLDREVPEEHTTKCMLACAHEKFGIIVDGKFSSDGLKAIEEKEFKDNEKATDIFNEMISECQDIDDPDVCELSTKLMDCFVKSATKAGIDPKKGIRKSLEFNKFV